MSDITANNFKAFYEQIRPYLGAVHSGFTPIGTVISVMGTTAPQNYLSCDGTAYNISDYPELAAYFNQQFGSSNFFGGDGTTTFAVPDLRGEFLRGTGTNSHANQGAGANVGVHQDGTEHLRVYAYKNNTIGTFAFNSNGHSSESNADSYISKGESQDKSTDLNFNETTSFGTYTSRPTNTSVLYCIASKNIFMDAGSNYSTEEQVVGTWIDGSYIYQRTWDNLSTSDVDMTRSGSWKVTTLSPDSGTVNRIIDSKTYRVESDQTLIPTIAYSVNSGVIYSFSIAETWSLASGGHIEVTLQYTKTTD